MLGVVVYRGEVFKGSFVEKLSEQQKTVAEKKYMRYEMTDGNFMRFKMTPEEIIV